MKRFAVILCALVAIAALVVRPPRFAGPAAPAPATDPPGRAPAATALDARPVGEAHSLAVLRPSPSIAVYVAGEVNCPGVYVLAAGSRAQAALARAGGAKADADLVAVNLAQRLDDGTELAVPKIGDVVPAATQHAAHRRHRHGKHRRRHAAAADDGAATSAEPIDLNTADAAALQTLPGIGPALADRIVAYRDQNGPFRSLDELADVAGMTPAIQTHAGSRLVVR